MCPSSSESGRDRPDECAGPMALPHPGNSDRRNVYNLCEYRSYYASLLALCSVVSECAGMRCVSQLGLVQSPLYKETLSCGTDYVLRMYNPFDCIFVTSGCFVACIGCPVVVRR